MKLIVTTIITLIFVCSNLSSQNLPKFSGLMFGDYFYYAAARNAEQKDLNGFQFRRIYFTADYSISDNFNTRFRLEAEQTNNSLTPGNKLGVMVKDAWLQWKNIFEGSNLVFGISPTPAFEVSERAWGHRHLEKTILDLFGVVSSRDFGIDLKGYLFESDLVNYWIKIGNNSSNGPEVNKYKRFYGSLEFNPAPELLITLYADYATSPEKFDPFDDEYKSNNSFVGSAFLNFRQRGIFSVGMEGFVKSQQNNYSPNSITTALDNQTGTGISMWAYFNLSETAQLVGRFDYMDPNTNAGKDGIGLILAGVQFNPIANVSVTPNIEIFTYQADSPNGGDKNDIIPRVTFFWEF